MFAGALWIDGRRGKASECRRFFFVIFDFGRGRCRWELARQKQKQTITY